MQAWGPKIRSLESSSKKLAVVVDACDLGAREEVDTGGSLGLTGQLASPSEGSLDPCERLLKNEALEE